MSSFKLTTFICPFCTVRITSGGVSGWGEAGQYGPPEPVASAIKVRRGEANSGLYSSFSTQDVLAKRIIGEEVRPTVISDQLYSFSRDFGQRGTYVEAISGKHRSSLVSCSLVSEVTQALTWHSGTCWGSNSEFPSVNCLVATSETE